MKYFVLSGMGMHVTHFADSHNASHKQPIVSLILCHMGLVLSTLEVLTKLTCTLHKACFFLGLQWEIGQRKRLVMHQVYYLNFFKIHIGFKDTIVAVGRHAHMSNLKNIHAGQQDPKTRTLPLCVWPNDISWEECCRHF